MSDAFDVVVIGGGPGGYVAAIRAAQLGLKTAVVEKEHLGGICLNWGCIPTKALLRTSELYHMMHRADEFGLKVSGVSFDIKKIVKRSREVSAKLSSGIAHLMKKNKVEVFEGHGKWAGNGLVVVEGKKEKQTLKSKHTIIATGARARVLPGIEPDGKVIWSYREAMVPDKLPKSLVVIGSGAIGIEFASFYQTLGTKVTVVEVMDRILPVEDKEISAIAQKQFEAQGMEILTSAKVLGVKAGKSGADVEIEVGGKKKKIKCENVLSAVGIVGNVENLGISNTRVKVEKSHIVTDEWGATGEKGLYAIGDVAGPPWLAHKASHEGIICVEKIAGVQGAHPMDPKNIPGCTYSHPQVASVGLTEEKAIEAGHEVRVGRFPFMGNGKAIAMGEPEGLIKTIFDSKTGELLGAHMVGADVTELIQGYCVAKTLETTEAELMHTVFPHPTLSEMMHESVLQAYDRAIHI